MRKLFVVILSLALVMGLGGCASDRTDPTRGYDLIEENGEWYMLLDLGTEPIEGDSNQNEVTGVRSIECSSVAEMKHDIKTGDFSEEELSIIATFKRDEAGRVPVCDLTSLYTPRYPADFDSYVVYWRENNYRFSIKSDDNDVHASLKLMGESAWSQAVDECSNFAEQTTCTIHTVTTEDNRNATVYLFDSKDGMPSKGVFYTVSTDDHLLYIWERYKTDESDTVPVSISIYGLDEDKYFRVYLSSLQERPSVEWLSQFGLTPYLG